MKKRTDERPKPNWLAKCVVIRRKKLSWRAKEELRHDRVYDTKDHMVIRGHRDLVYDPKVSQGH